MNPKNNNNDQPQILLLEAPKAVPAAKPETPPVEANKGVSEALLDPSDPRKYGQNTGRDPATGQFLPGNPGKPMGARHFTTLFREAVREFGGVTKDGQKVTFDRVIAKKLITMAADGNLKAATIVIDRVDGKVPQMVEVNKTERIGVLVYSPKEQEEYELMFSRNDKPKTYSIPEAGNDGGTQSTEGAAQGSAYE